MLPGMLLRHLPGKLRQLSRLRTAALAAVGLLLACGGDDGSTDGGADATQGTDGAQGNDASADAPSDGTAPGPDGCVPVEGGLACDPGHVTCGTTPCDVATQFCCITDGGAKQTCDTDPPDSGKPPPATCTTGSKAFCDEAADCPSGQLCCGFVGAGGGFATTCAASCGTGIQFCRGSAECTSGSCVVQQCRGENVETCGSFCP